jgi:hypothetical protein
VTPVPELVISSFLSAPLSVDIFRISTHIIFLHYFLRAMRFKLKITFAQTIHRDKLKVKQSHYRPGQALGFP